jgi:hypothetical protein
MPSKTHKLCSQLGGGEPQGTEVIMHGKLDCLQSSPDISGRRVAQKMGHSRMLTSGAIRPYDMLCVLLLAVTARMQLGVRLRHLAGGPVALGNTSRPGGYAHPLPAGNAVSAGTLQRALAK